MTGEPRKPGPVREQADEACHGPLREVGPALAPEVWAPLTELMEEVRTAHVEAVSASSLEEPCPEDPAEARERAAGYVRRVAETVQAPMLDGLRRLATADAAVALATRADQRSRRGATALPGRTTIAREKGDLQPGEFDGTRRRLGRSVARVLASVGLAGATRQVDVRSVVERHRALRLAPGTARWQDEAHRAWCQWLRQAEGGWSAWVGALLSSLPPREEEDAPATELWETVAEAAAALDSSFETLSASNPFDALTAATERDVRRWSAMLASDLSVAGTFLFRARPHARGSRGSTERRQAAGWTEWEQQALDRFELHRAVLSVFLTSRRTRRELRGRLEGEALAGWTEATVACAEKLRSCAARVRDGGPPTERSLAKVQADAEAALEEAKEACPSPANLEALSRRAAGLAIGTIQGGLRKVPDTLEIHGLASGPMRRPTGATQTVALQDMARQAFDALRMERIRKAPTALVEAVEPMIGGLQEVSEIVAFGFEAASSELAGESEDPEAGALELVVEGLERAATAVENVPEPLADAIRTVHRAVADEVMKGAGVLVNRALAHRVQGQILDAPTRLAGAAEALRRRFGPGFRREAQRLRYAWLVLRRAASRLMRRGRSLMGTEGAEPTAAARTARSLALADQMVESLPLVYQHLFSPDPVTDPALLAGRDRELAEAERRWRRWQEGKGVPLLVIGRRGYGISSFFNVFLGRLGGEEISTEHRVLETRLPDEPALAAFLAEILGLQEEASLDGLAACILEAPDDTLPDVVALEGLEHVYLRVPGGTDLLERLFTLMAETEPRIFWIASLTSSAWQVVRKADPAPAGQMDCLDLGAVSAADLRTALMHRHRRSGLEVEFREPAEGRRLLRRRLRRLRGTERHQELLRADYFDRLERSAHGNLRLAFFLWLRSVDFSRGDRGLVVRPLTTLDWSFLDSLDLTQSFTIKAFLEHDTLTLAEHDAVFRVTRQESYHIFESLLNRQLIEIVEEEEDEDHIVSRVVDDARYRLRPLITGAVAMNLASKNIVH